jgi:hypothetical protein
MFRNWFGKKAAPLTGAPAVRRQKTYSAQSGYVYQYFYEGRRGESEFVFTVSSDRKTWHESSVHVAAAAIQPWEQAHGRSLSGTERYALAKMALFAAFDERASPDLVQQPIHVAEDNVAAIMERLDLE